MALFTCVGIIWCALGLVYLFHCGPQAAMNAFSYIQALEVLRRFWLGSLKNSLRSSFRIVDSSHIFQLDLIIFD